MSGCSRLIHQLLRWMSGVSLSLLLTPKSTVIHLRLGKQAVVNQLKWVTAPGICGIHAELLKAGGNAVLMSLNAILCSAWNTVIIPTDWKRGLVVPLWKGKGQQDSLPVSWNDTCVPGRAQNCMQRQEYSNSTSLEKFSMDATDRRSFIPFQPVHRSLCFQK